MMVFFWLNWAMVAAAAVLWLYPETTRPLVRLFFSALAFKLVCALALGGLYLNYFHRGDTFRFFNDGALLAQLAATRPGEYLAFLWHGNDASAVWHQLATTEPRSLFFTKFVSLICLVAGNNYWLCALWLALISFVSSWLLVQRLAINHPNHTVSFAIALLFWPSVVFWSSGVLKETVALAAVLWLVRLTIEFSGSRKLSAATAAQALACFWIAWSLKYYWIGLLAPFLILVAGQGYRNFWRLAALAGVCLGLVLALHPNFYPSRVLHVITDNYFQYHVLTGGNNTFRFAHLEPTWASVLTYSPAALFFGLFRPFLWESTTFFHVLAALENLALLALTISALLRFRLPPEVRGWALPLLVYACLECTFLALSTPSWGTLTRYRVGMLPFFLLFVLVANGYIRQFLQRKVD